MVNAIDIKQILDQNYPAFKRRPDLVDAYVNHAKTILSGQKNKQTYIQGQDGVLVPENLLQELKQKGIRLSIKSNQLTGLPNKTTIDDVIAIVIQEVQNQVPEMYQPRVIEQLKGLKHNYAATLEEAANVLGVELSSK